MNRKDISAENRLIIAVDIQPPETKPRRPVHEVIEDEIFDIARSFGLHGPHPHIKLNSALRAVPYDVITQIRAAGIGFFADLKLNDISETLAIDGAILRFYKPEFVTVMCNAGPSAINALQQKCSNETMVVGVTVLTSLGEEDCQQIYGSDIKSTVLRLIDLTISKTPVRSFVCSSAEVPIIREHFGDEVCLIIPAIRPKSLVVIKDDQDAKRIATPENAIKAGSDYLVVGRPIMNAQNRELAIRQVQNEIRSALEA